MTKMLMRFLEPLTVTEKSDTSERAAELKIGI